MPSTPQQSRSNQLILVRSYEVLKPFPEPSALTQHFAACAARDGHGRTARRGDGSLRPGQPPAPAGNLLLHRAPLSLRALLSIPCRSPATRILCRLATSCGVMRRDPGLETMTAWQQLGAAAVAAVPVLL